jgi:beta-RFAP synthase
MTRVRTASRLHFGLLSLPGAWAGRQFGGAGLMVEAPGNDLEVTQASRWSSEGPLAERALRFAREVAQGLPADRVRPQRLIIRRAAPEHVGLGTGTQLGLAVARAVLANLGLPDEPPEDLARRIGRGLRSALGIHGFAHGGLLVDGGKGAAERVAPLVARADFPGAWRVIVVLPPGAPGLHGEPEVEAFRRLEGRPPAPEWTDRLCRLVLLGMLPAVAEGDLDAFGEAVYDFNRQVGEAFSSVQGDTYADPRAAELVHFFRNRGVRGTGQSSWGPAAFAFVRDAEEADALAGAVRTRFGLSAEEAFVTAGCNRGATVEK